MQDERGCVCECCPMTKGSRHLQGKKHRININNRQLMMTIACGLWGLSGLRAV